MAPMVVSLTPALSWFYLITRFTPFPSSYLRKCSCLENPITSISSGPALTPLNPKTFPHSSSLTPGLFPSTILSITVLPVPISSGSITVSSLTPIFPTNALPTLITSSATSRPLLSTPYDNPTSIFQSPTLSFISSTSTQNTYAIPTSYNMSASSHQSATLSFTSVVSPTQSEPLHKYPGSRKELGFLAFLVIPAVATLVMAVILLSRSKRTKEETGREDRASVVDESPSRINYGWNELKDRSGKLPTTEKHLGDTGIQNSLHSSHHPLYPQPTYQSHPDATPFLLPSSSTRRHRETAQISNLPPLIMPQGRRRLSRRSFSHRSQNSFSTRTNEDLTSMPYLTHSHRYPLYRGRGNEISTTDHRSISNNGIDESPFTSKNAFEVVIGSRVSDIGGSIMAARSAPFFVNSKPSNPDPYTQFPSQTTSQRQKHRVM